MAARRGTVLLGPRATPVGRHPVRRRDDDREGRWSVLVVLGVAAADRPERRSLDDQHGRSHAPGAAQARVAPVQPGWRTRARRPRARPGDRHPRSRRAAGGVRGGRGDRVAVAGDDDRRPARVPARHVGAAASLVGAHHDAGRPEHDRRPAVRFAPRGRPGHGRLLHADRGAGRGTSHRTARRPHLGVGRAGLGDRARARGDVAPARRRRGDDAHRHRLDHPRARAPTRPAPAAGGAPRTPLDHRGRGVHPMGDADPQHAAHRHRGARAARADVARGRPGGAHVRGGEPRPARSPSPTVST